LPVDDYLMPWLSSGLATRTRRPRPSGKTTLRVISHPFPLAYRCRAGAHAEGRATRSKGCGLVPPTVSSVFSEKRALPSWDPGLDCRRDFVYSSHVAVKRGEIQARKGGTGGGFVPRKEGFSCSKFFPTGHSLALGRKRR
jgi:hypothetical protein